MRCFNEPSANRNLMATAEASKCRYTPFLLIARIGSLPVAPLPGTGSRSRPSGLRQRFQPCVDFVLFDTIRRLLVHQSVVGGQVVSVGGVFLEQGKLPGFGPLDCI